MVRPKEDGGNALVIVLSVISGLVVLALIGFFVFTHLRKKRDRLVAQELLDSQGTFVGGQQINQTNLNTMTTQ